jgi:hypothetical protein
MSDNELVTDQVPRPAFYVILAYWEEDMGLTLDQGGDGFRSPRGRHFSRKELLGGPDCVLLDRLRLCHGAAHVVTFFNYPPDPDDPEDSGTRVDPGSYDEALTVFNRWARVAMAELLRRLWLKRPTPDEIRADQWRRHQERQERSRELEERRLQVQAERARRNGPGRGE